MENQNIIIYTDDKGQISIDIKNETIWLNQNQMAEIFGTKQPAISKHLSNIFKSGELDKNSVHSIMEYTANDGKRYETSFYSLDAALSVGYRVNSKRATEFRKWATKILKEYLIEGYAINQKKLTQGGINELTATIELIKKSIEQKELGSDGEDMKIQGIKYF